MLYLHCLEPSESFNDLNIEFFSMYMINDKDLLDKRNTHVLKKENWLPLLTLTMNSYFCVMYFESMWMIVLVCGFSYFKDSMLFRFLKFQDIDLKWLPNSFWKHFLHFYRRSQYHTSPKIWSEGFFSPPFLK